MRYLGGKFKIRKQVSSFLESVRKPGQIYFEPFVGGAWVLQEMTGKRIASDGNKALVAMYKALQNGWIPPTFVSEEEYQQVRKANNPADPMTIFCGIGCSFAGKLWGGYARSDGKTCYAQTSHNSLMKQLPKIKDVKFIDGLFHEHKPEGMLVYCDPPYQGTTQYGAFDSFDHALFWQTMREWSKNNTVVVSEYNSPKDFKCVAQFGSRMGMTTGNARPVRTESLFMYAG